MFGFAKINSSKLYTLIITIHTKNYQKKKKYILKHIFKF